MRNNKQPIPATVERFAGDSPEQEIEIIPPFNVQGEDGSTLSHGNRYLVGGKFAERLIKCGQAFDVKTGARRVTPKSDVATPKAPPRSGRTVRVRVRAPFSIQVENGETLEAAGEYTIPIELFRSVADRVDLLDVEQLPVRKLIPTGEPHLVRIIGFGSGPGSGIWSVALDRHVEFGEEITVPDSEAEILINIGRAVSLRPEMPDPAIEEFAELVAGGDEKKQSRVATLAARLLKRRA